MKSVNEQHNLQVLNISFNDAQPKIVYLEHMGNVAAHISHDMKECQPLPRWWSAERER